MMMTWQTICRLCFFVIVVVCATTDARAIEENTLDQLEIEPSSENEDALKTLTNYRHRFEHSKNIRTLRWMFQQHNDADDVLCKMCDILLPIVSRIFAFSYMSVWNRRSTIVSNTY